MVSALIEERMSGGFVREANIFKTDRLEVRNMISDKVTRALPEYNTDQVDEIVGYIMSGNIQLTSLDTQEMSVQLAGVLDGQ